MFVKWPKLLFFAMLYSLAFCKYSYSDKCYRFEVSRHIYNFYYQYYFNKKGLPISADEIVNEYTDSKERYSIHSFYYHRELYNCTLNENTYDCDSVIESVWFKILNTTTAKYYVHICDPIFIKKYGDVTKHNCTGGDPFRYIRSRIGEKSKISIEMNGKTPRPPKGYDPSDEECVWEYEILGLIPIVTLIVIGVIIVCCLIAFIVIFIIAQKHRSVKRQRLEGSLIRSTDNSV